MMKRCSKCGELKELTDFYKAKTEKDGHRCECVDCSKKSGKEYRSRRKEYLKNFQNKESSCYLGVNVAERLCSHLFKDVIRMPNNNPGFDIICNQDKKIDVKSACIKMHQKKYPHWSFHIKKNTTADYFMLLAFNNRIDMIPVHQWLVPGHILNHLISTGISPSTIDKWDEWKQPIGPALSCCNEMKNNFEQ